MKPSRGHLEGRGENREKKRKRSRGRRRRTKPSGSPWKNESSAKITPGGQLIGLLVHKIFHLDSYPPKAIHTNINKHKMGLTLIHMHAHELVLSST